MTRRVVAFFACSVLTVTMTIPAMAEEAAGSIEGIDRDGASLRLTDGKTYVLPDDFDTARLEPGMEVHVLFERAN